MTTAQSTSAIGWSFTPGSKSGTPGTTGGITNYATSTWTDSATAGSGTATNWVGHAFQRPTLAASNASVTTTNAATVYIADSPLAGTNETLTNAYALWVDAGNVRFDGDFNLTPAGLIQMFGGSSTPTGWLDCDGSAVSRTTYATLFAAISTTWGSGDGSSTFNVPDLRGRVPIGSGTGTNTESFTNAAVNTGSDQVTVASNADKWVTGMLVTFTTGGTPPTTSPANLLDNNDTVYIIRSSSTVIQFATTLANAQNGTAIDITAAGSGTFTITQTLTARTLGAGGGEESHAMSLTELLSHTHVFDRSGAAGSGGSLDSTGAGTKTTDARGGNAAMNIMQPYGVVKYIIKT